MKILTVANEKGGVGKTFFSTQFAFYCALKFGLRVALIDLDQQANASRCLAIKDYAVKADVKSADLLLGTADIKHFTDKLVYFEADDRLSMLEKQGDTGLYHVARIKQWLSYLRKEYDEATELFQHVRVLNNSPDIARAIQAIDIEKL